MANEFETLSPAFVYKHQTIMAVQPTPLTSPSRNRFNKAFLQETNGFHKALLRVHLLVDQSPWKMQIIKSPRIKRLIFSTPTVPTAGSGGHLATGTAHRTWVAWRRWVNSWEERLVKRKIWSINGKKGGHWLLLRVFFKVGPLTL